MPSRVIRPSFPGRTAMGAEPDGLDGGRDQALRLWRQRKSVFSLSIAALLGVALLGVLPGIAIAVSLSILAVFRRAWWPYSTELGRVPGLEGYHDVDTHPDAQRLRSLVIYRFDAPLFYANVRTFRDQIRRF